jgi:hypothetical protein
MRALQKELDDLRKDKERDSRGAREDGKELMLLRKRCERLENERASGGPRGFVYALIHHSKYRF